jgi:hypothetical protein
MSASATVSTAVLTKDDPEKGHRTRVRLAWLAALSVVLVFLGYGLNYYTLSSTQRPFSPKHHLLRPSGPIGIKLGMFGVLLFFLIYLYPLRKKWTWLGRQGNARHWLDFHIVMGTTAPMIIALHASFKFGNIAGMAFWSMMMVTISGFVGRYLYAQIPRGITAAELSKKEMAEKEEALRKQLEEQKEAFGFAVEALYHLPTAQEVAHSSTIEAIISMILIDCRRPFEASLVRLRSTGFFPWLFSFCGLRATGDYKLERAITVASTQSALSKRVMYLSKTHKMFELWHVIHRPFSYAFAILAIIHISLALFMGYRI